MTAAGSAGVLRGEEGRLRIGWRLGLFLLLFLAFALAGSLFPLPGIPGATLPLLVAALAAGWILLALDGRPPGALGFHLSRAAAPETAAGLALGVGAALATVALIALAGGIAWSTAGGPGATAVAFAGAGLGALWLFALPAAAEEALFRGYPFQALAESWGPAPALLVSSAAFGLVHALNPAVTWLGMVNILIAGVFLGVVYIRTASLWWATAAHLGWNWTHGFLVALPVSGLELVENPLVEAEARGPAWLSGGAFGPEGSALSALLLLGVSGWLWRTRALRPEALGRGALRHPPLWAQRMPREDREAGATTGGNG